MICLKISTDHVALSVLDASFPFERFGLQCPLQLMNELCNHAIISQSYVAPNCNSQLCNFRCQQTKKRYYSNPDLIYVTLHKTVMIRVLSLTKEHPCLQILRLYHLVNAKASVNLARRQSQVREAWLRWPMGAINCKYQQKRKKKEMIPTLIILLAEASQASIV